MGLTKQLLTEERARIVLLKDQGLSCRKIAGIVGCAANTVSTTCVRFRETGACSDRKRSGRPQKLSEKEKWMVIRRSVADRRRSPWELAAELQKSHQKTVSAWTIQSILSDNRLQGCVAGKAARGSGIEKELGSVSRDREIAGGVERNGHGEADGTGKRTFGEALAACQLIRRYFQQCKCDFNELCLNIVESDIRNSRL